MSPAPSTPDRGVDAPVIRSVGTALPDQTYAQSEILETAERLLSPVDADEEVELLEYFFDAVDVSRRHLVLPLDAYADVAGFGEATDLFERHATQLGTRAVSDALDRAGRSPGDVDALFFTTVTGISAPSIDAKIVNELDLPRSVERTPMFGLGCVAGAAGTSRAADYLRAHPDATAVLLSVELCSLTFQRNDVSVPNQLATSLFADGAAAAVMSGRENFANSRASAPEIVANRSIFYPDTEWVMGWELDGDGFHVVLSGDLAEVLSGRLRGDADEFLTAHDLELGDVDHWIGHPGGPAVLEAVADEFELDRSELARSWNSLDRLGNLSSASVLFVLEQTLNDAEVEPGDRGLMFAMGPGFSAEFVLLEW
ncbi:MAG: type III polyketide synthase [Bradymonadaceae bacterium]